VVAEVAEVTKLFLVQAEQEVEVKVEDMTQMEYLIKFLVKLVQPTEVVGVVALKLQQCQLVTLVQVVQE
jgi:hypothetical protein|tara:strand:+ start:296 stop:502 length:207 start_codon:yes stop_codon:yes gene_type:complete